MPSYTATLNRFEIKYLIWTREIPDVSAELGEYMSADPHDPRGEGYSVFSIYWDTPTLSFFWEKIEGLKSRRKLRFRRYAGSEQVFLEIKAREDRTLQKRRATWPLERVQRAFGDGRQLDWGAVAGDRTGEEAMLMAQRLQLRPTAGILYRRRALFGVFDPELRITFDSRILYRTAGLDLGQPFVTGKHVIDPRATVMEIKYNHRAPVWLTKMVRRRGLQMIRMSKYCTALDREYFDHQLT